jgi:cytochrome P450 family 142 subfamily A polypeptide 1
MTVTDVDRGTAPEVDLMSGAFWGEPHHDALAWLRANDPVHWDGRVWGVTRHALIKEVARRPDVFSNASGMRPDLDPLPMMTDMDDPEHRQRRSLVGKAFSPRRVRDDEPAVRRACQHILDEISPMGGCDFVADVAAWLPMIMIGDALGIAPADRGLLLQWSDDMACGLVGGAGGDAAMAKATESFLVFREYLLTAIADRRRRPTDDLLSVLVHAEIDGVGLDDEIIVQEAVLLLIAGDETTRHVLSGGLYQLLRHREQWDQLCRDRSLVPTAVEEMLRWVSPVKTMGRRVTRPVELGGRQLQPGDDVLLVYPAANRDERVFDEPDRFDITRDPNEHLAFGIGTHFCLGAALARIELVCLFEALLERMPDLHLVDDAEPPDRGLNFVTGYRTMPVRFGAWQHTIETAAPSAPERCPDIAWSGADSRWHDLARGLREVSSLHASDSSQILELAVVDARGSSTDGATVGDGADAAEPAPAEPTRS